MSRRLTISSLLCDDNNDNSEPRIIPEPVVLAPHLRRSPQRVEPDSTRNSSQPTASLSSKIGLDALVHAASTVAAAEDRSRLPAPNSSSSSWSSEGHYPQTPNYTYSQEQLQRQQQQLEQRHVHREQILGYNEHHRTGRKSDPLPGPGMRNILSPSVSTSETPYHPSSSSSLAPRFSHDADEHLNKKRRYSQEEHQARELERLRQQEDADRYRRIEEEREQHHRRLQQETIDDMERIRNKTTVNNPPSRSSISALTNPTVASITTSPSLPSRRAGAGYDPVHENDHHPAHTVPHTSSHWDRIQSPSQQFPSAQYSQKTQRPMELIEINERESEDDRAKRAWNGHRELSTHASYHHVTQESQPRTHIQSMPSAYRESHPATLSPTANQERPQSRSDPSVHHTFPREILSPTSAASARSPHFQHDIIHNSEIQGTHHVQHIQREPRRDSPLPPSFAAPQHISRESQPSASSHTHPQVPHIPHQSRDAPQQHRVISPIGRRSPPGSQAGRAIAAKKVEQEHQMPSMESVLRIGTPVTTLTLPLEEVKLKREMSAVSVNSRESESSVVMEQELEKGKEREVKKKERKSSRSKEVSHMGPITVKPEESTSHLPLPSLGSSVPRQIAHRSPSESSPSQSIQQHQVEDPHEWLLEQYADDDRQKIKRPTSTLSSIAVITKSDPGSHSTTSPIARKPPKSPMIPSPSSLSKRDDVQTKKDRDDATMALEQELDAELAEAVVDQKGLPYDGDAMEVDVDQAVAELVGETLGADASTPATGEDGEKREPRHEQQHDKDDKAMDVDVEDELLSLLDDRPNSRMSASALSAAPSSSSVPETRRPSKTKTPASLRMKNEEAGSRPSSPLAVSAGSPFRSSSITGARQSSAKPSEQDDRESMPPPSTPIEKSEMPVAAAQTKKKGKPGPKPKPRNPDGTIVGAPPPPPKPRGKPGPKPKPRDEFGNIIRTSSASSTPAPGTTPTTKTGRASSSTAHASTQINRTASGSGATASSISGARSRSTSAHPAGSVGPEVDGQAKEEDKEEEKEEEEDDKLYCLCKTKYDEDKPMIACDSCDEWYHMKCVEIPEYMGDLVDQFFCPPCIEKNPSAHLKTTYKARCLFGINSLEAGATKPCHKPARPFSKYCSDECGVKNIRKRIDNFTKKGGKKEDLWESVKTASKREGLVRVISPSSAMQVDGLETDVLKPIIREVQPTRTKQEREIDRLNGLLADIERLRDELHRGMDILLSREKLLQLATDRSENLEQCGWDQRLCFSDEDWADYGEGVLESYAEQDGSAENNAGEAEWWCPGDQECERHAGWQGLRAKDIDKEKEKKEEALFKLTSREREIRKRIDRIEEQDAVPLLGTALRRGGGPPKSNKLSNGHTTKVKVNGDTSKKGKKRKTVSS
ncbi:hypothetical protein F5890DRAFT_1508673 [Lentinula detonsa]|uniref:PHD-type domain-containing protein n=1 Tax=Lentinula detonsa TaxID=2804962 RepID=A0AA38Q2F2_9AGAR|nr:hypothetical protein F5890DRAFT_1508673 [Lentinula detonsa]